MRCGTFGACWSRAPTPIRCDKWRACRATPNGFAFPIIRRGFRKPRKSLPLHSLGIRSSTVPRAGLPMTLAVAVALVDPVGAVRALCDADPALDLQQRRRVVSAFIGNFFAQNDTVVVRAFNFNGGRSRPAAAARARSNKTSNGRSIRPTARTIALLSEDRSSSASLR
jgi:hypothetical protein